MESKYIYAKVDGLTYLSSRCSYEYMLICWKSHDAAVPWLISEIYRYTYMYLLCLEVCLLKIYLRYYGPNHSITEPFRSQKDVLSNAHVRR